LFCAANLHRLSTFPQQRISDEARTFAVAERRVLQVFAGSLPARSAPALHCSFSVAEFRTDRPKSGKFAGQSEISDLPPISVSRREPAASCRGNASASVRYRGQRRRIDIPILLLIRPELEPQTIHHFDSGVSLFWTDLILYG
jgi:hypothetical protein